MDKDFLTHLNKSLGPVLAMMGIHMSEHGPGIDLDGEGLVVMKEDGPSFVPYTVESDKNVTE